MASAQWENLFVDDLWNIPYVIFKDSICGRPVASQPEILGSNLAIDILIKIFYAYTVEPGVWIDNNTE